MKSFTCFSLNLFFVTTLFAQAGQEKQTDSLKISFLDEVVIAATKIPEPRKTLAQQIKVISPNEIKNSHAQTTADLLESTGMVAMQRSQQGGGSPMIRGFEANRVLLILDGVRMNNLIYRTGHLQNAITIDNNILDRAEILFGSASTVYGSDALGGAVHFYTRNPELAKEKKILTSGNSLLRYGTVNHEKTVHADFTLSGKKIASLTSMTMSDFGDLKMGKRVNPALGEGFGYRPYYAQRKQDNSGNELILNPDSLIQKSTGYKQYDFLQKFLFTQREDVQHLLNFQYSTSSNIPRYDRLTDPQGGGLRPVWYYGPQKRMLTSYQLKIRSNHKFFDSFTSTISYQQIEESRHDQKFNDNQLNHRIEKVDVFAVTVDLQKTMPSSKIQYGFDSQFNSLKSVAHSENIVTQAISPLSTRYPNGNNTMNFMALYLTSSYYVNPNLTLNYGGRFGTFRLQSSLVNNGTFADLPFQKADQQNWIGSANVGLVYRPKESWRISILANTGFRTPNVDDLSKIFDPTPGTVVVPNSHLRPEKTFNVECGITKHFRFGLDWENNFYITRFSDIIVSDDFIFQGMDSIDYDGVLSKVQANQNKGRAYLYGYSSALKAEIGKYITVIGSLNYTYGRIETDTTDTPLDHIPPMFGRLGITLGKGKFRSEVFVNFNGWKRLKDYSLNGEDNMVYAPQQGMPVWYTINFRLGYEWGKHIILQAGVDNVMDLQYRTFASGLNAPGRNFFWSLRVRF